MPRKIDLDTGEITGSQPALIPMSEEELKAAGRQLAQKVRELAVLRADHAEERKEHKLAEDRLASEIEGIAETIRTQGR
jgi:hypothetical protein